MPLCHSLGAINHKMNRIEIKYNMLCFRLTIMFSQQKKMLKVYELDIKFPLFMSRFYDCMIVQFQSLDYAVVRKYGPLYKHIIKLKHHSDSIGQKSMHESNMFLNHWLSQNLPKKLKI